MAKGVAAWPEKLPVKKLRSGGDHHRDRVAAAAGSGDIEAVKQFIAAGADVNAKDSRGWTPLHPAATYGRKEVAELLIAKGADVNAKGRGFLQTPLQLAANGGHKEIAELLVAEGADVNTKTDKPLHMAALWGEKEIVELLIAEGADVNAQYANGKTALDSAIQQKKTETADLLRKHGGKTWKELKAAGK